MIRNIALLGAVTLLLLTGCADKSVVPNQPEVKTPEVMVEDEKLDWLTYETDTFTFQYPPDYQVDSKDEGFLRATTVYKDDSSLSRLELFYHEDFGGDRPFGFTGEETDDDIFLRETHSIGDGPEIDRLDVWFSYAETDPETKELFHEIFSTIKEK